MKTKNNYLPVISVMLVGAKYLRVGNCLFLCVQGWGGEHKVKKYIYICKFLEVIYQQ